MLKIAFASNLQLFFYRKYFRVPNNKGEYGMQHPGHFKAGLQSTAQCSISSQMEILPSHSHNTSKYSQVTVTFSHEQEQSKNS